MTELGTLAQALVTAARRGRPAVVRELLRDADEPARKACLPAVKALAKAQREDDLGWRSGVPLAVVLARLGTAPGAAAVVTVLRTRLYDYVDAPDDVVGVLVERGVPWLPAVVERFAEVPVADVWASHWPVLEALRVATGQPRPRTEPYLRGLVRSLDPFQRVVDLPAALDADPTLAALLLPVLEVPEIGAVLGARGRAVASSAPKEHGWDEVLAARARAGTLDRAALLGTVLDVLLRGGGRLHLAFFTRLLDALAPTDDEVLARAGTWVRLVADGTGPAAAAAQRRLRELDAAGRLDVETVLDVGRLALARPEKAVAVAQLSWLGAVAARLPDRASDVALVVAEGLRHERPDVQERTLVALARSAPLPEAVAEAVRDALPALPAVLQPQAQALATAPEDEGADDEGARAVAEVVAEVVAAPTPAEQPVRDLAELVDVVGRHLHGGGHLGAERALDGLSALAATDPDAFARALEPFRDRWQEPREATGRSVTAALGLDPVLGVLHVLLTGRRQGLLSRVMSRGQLWPDPAGVEGLLSARGREVAERVLAGTSRRLLALPDTAAGATDPERVVAGLERDAREGRDGGTADAQQAALRLPRAPLEPGLRARLDALTTPAAATVRALLDDRPEPVATVVGLPQHEPDWAGAQPSLLGGLPVVDLAPRTGSRLEARLFTAALSEGGPWWLASDPELVLLTLPQHRDVAAAHAVGQLVDVLHAPSASALRVVVLLPEAGGPCGPATALAVAYAAAGEGLATRTAAVDALHGFAVHGGLPPALFGQTLAALLRHEPVKPGRLAATLGEVLRGPLPARRLVWESLAAALPELLVQRRRGAHVLLAVAAEAAATTAARGEVPGLAALADERGSSRWHVEARRLRGLLSGA